MVEGHIEDLGEDYEEDDSVDSNVDALDIQQEAGDETSPDFAKTEDLYSLFWKVINTEDSSKVGNLSREELGLLDISVRDCQRIALLAYSLGHPGFGNFFKNHAEITLATSSSKEGWLPELFVSQKKFAQKTRKYNIQNLQPQKKKGLFKK